MRQGFVCQGCGGPVRLSRAVIRVQLDTGRLNPETGKPILINKLFRGLGTWKCLKGCPKRRLTVNRFTGSGAENMRTSVAPWPVERPIAVRRA